MAVAHGAAELDGSINSGPDAIEKLTSQAPKNVVYMYRGVCCGQPSSDFMSLALYQPSSTLRVYFSFLDTIRSSLPKKASSKTWQGLLGKQGFSYGHGSNYAHIGPSGNCNRAGASPSPSCFLRPSVSLRIPGPRTFFSSCEPSSFCSVVISLPETVSPPSKKHQDPTPARTGKRDHKNTYRYK